MRQKERLAEAVKVLERLRDFPEKECQCQWAEDCGCKDVMADIAGKALQTISPTRRD